MHRRTWERHLAIRACNKKVGFRPLIKLDTESIAFACAKNKRVLAAGHVSIRIEKRRSLPSFSPALKPIPPLLAEQTLSPGVRLLARLLCAEMLGNGDLPGHDVPGYLRHNELNWNRRAGRIEINGFMQSAIFELDPGVIQHDPHRITSRPVVRVLQPEPQGTERKRPDLLCKVKV